MIQDEVIIAITQLAKANGIEPRALLAIKLVETGEGSGFTDGRPSILFEGHVFYKYYHQKYPKVDMKNLCMTYPNICYEKWNKKYYLGGSKEWDRFHLAQSLDEECAILSTSWGIGQIMGFNYSQCGSVNLNDFVDRMVESTDSQLQLWINFILNMRLKDVINNHDWSTFARKYNGSGQIYYYSGQLSKMYDKVRTYIK